MTSCPICNHVNPAGTARCGKCDTWLAQAADTGLKPQVRRGGDAAGSAGAGLTPEFAAELQELLREGQKITAIARFREVTGLGLRESKDAVEALEAGRSLPSSAAAAAGVDEVQIVALLRESQFIKAIKAYREATGLGLKEAKEAVEAIAARHADSADAERLLRCVTARDVVAAGRLGRGETARAVARLAAQRDSGRL